MYAPMRSLIYSVLNPSLYLHYFPIDMRKLMPCILETNIPIKGHTTPVKGDSSDMLKIW